MPGPRRRPWAYVGLVVLGLALGLVVLEGSLQIAALVASRWHAFDSPGDTAERRRVLALGDSNTFGLYVGKGRAYPHLLESRWNSHRDRRPIDVINVGYPGNSSSSIRAQLGDLLATYRPQVVTVMIGGNDWWREPEPLADASVDACVRRAEAPTAAGAPSWRPRWRVMRLLRLLEQWLPVPTAHLLDDRLPPRRARADPAWAAALDANLRAIAACIQRTGGQPMFLTYPSGGGPYGLANQTIRAVAAGANVPLLDVAHRVGERCPRQACEYLYPAPDQHPTAAGHAWVAALLEAALVEVTERPGGMHGVSPGSPPARHPARRRTARAHPSWERSRSSTAPRP
jgi:lysophospholipase L1-like esterase